MPACGTRVKPQQCDCDACRADTEDAAAFFGVDGEVAIWHCPSCDHRWARETLR